MAERQPTRQRLLGAGMRLFAERGFSATTVGDIEAAAGLQPRRGGLYKHFASKEALLHEAVHRHLDDVAIGAAQIAELDFTAASTDPDLLRPVIDALGHWFLDELDRQRDLTLVLEHDRTRFADVATQLRSDLIDTGNRAAADLLAATVPGVEDPEATAVVLLGALVALRRTAWTFGAPPLDLDDDRALRAWTDLTLAVIARAPR